MQKDTQIDRSSWLLPKALNSRKYPRAIFRGRAKIMITLVAGILLTIGIPNTVHAHPLKVALDNLANQVAIEVMKHGKQIIAMTDLNDLGGKATETSLFFSEELLNRLGKDKRISFVERRDLKKVLEELELHISGVVDSRSAKEVGSFLGAEVLCTGSVIDLLNGYKISVRMIDTESGKIFAVAEILVDKSEELGILEGKIPDADRLGKRSIAKYPKGNYLTNGGFQQGYSDWKRQLGDITKGFSQTEIISFSHGQSGKALHIRHKGEGFFQFSQIVFVPGPDLMFSASFQASVKEGMIIGFSGTGIVQIGLQYFDENGIKLGETVLVNYVKNPFADTPLIGVPRRNPDTYKTHYIEFPKDRFHQEYRIDIRQEIESNLLGIEPEGVRQIAVVLWCGATHPQAGTELWITDVSLKAK